MDRNRCLVPRWLFLAYIIPYKNPPQTDQFLQIPQCTRSICYIPCNRLAANTSFSDRRVRFGYLAGQLVPTPPEGLRSTLSTNKFGLQKGQTGD